MASWSQNLRSGGIWGSLGGLSGIILKRSKIVVKNLAINNIKLTALATVCIAIATNLSNSKIS